jgi:riboflavin kinase, archaea type
MQTIELMLLIAEKSARGPVRVTTASFARALAVTQQTVSVCLRNVEREGLIRRQASPSGTTISLTPAGRALLRSYQGRLAAIAKSPRVISGRVFSGLGEGRFYITQPGYLRSLRQQLRLKPTPGTLNLRVDPVERSAFLDGIDPFVVKGFRTSKRTFGSLRVYPVHIASLRAAVVIPERSHYADDTLEMIADVNLRARLRLRDGSVVKVRG